MYCFDGEFSSRTTGKVSILFLAPRPGNSLPRAREDGGSRELLQQEFPLFALPACFFAIRTRRHAVAGPEGGREGDFAAVAGLGGDFRQRKIAFRQQVTDAVQPEFAQIIQRALVQVPAEEAVQHAGRKTGRRRTVGDTDVGERVLLKKIQRLLQFEMRYDKDIRAPAGDDRIRSNPYRLFRQMFPIHHSAERVGEQHADLTHFSGNVGGRHHRVLCNQRGDRVAEDGDLLRNLQPDLLQHPVDDVEVNAPLDEERGRFRDLPEKAFQRFENEPVALLLVVVEVGRPVAAEKVQSPLPGKLFEGFARILRDAVELSRPLPVPCDGDVLKPSRLDVVDDHRGHQRRVGVDRADIAPGRQFARHDGGIPEIGDPAQLLQPEIVGDHPVSAPVRIDRAGGVFHQPPVLPATAEYLPQNIFLHVAEGAEHMFHLAGRGS